jgi:putative membrane protein
MSMTHSFALHALVTWLLNACALLVTAQIIPGLQVQGFTSALVAALVLALVNAVLLPLLTILTLPLTILTLGLFWLFLNGAMLKLTAVFIPGFAVNGWLAAIVGAVVLTLVQALFRVAFRTFAT